MDIGNQLQKARMDAGLTQEQVAEALNISRQTLSNWENSRTSPDMKNAVALSELYGVSLDLLGKGMENVAEAPVGEIREKKRLPDLKPIWAYMVIWTGSVMIFHLFMGGSDGLGFSIFFQYMLLPVTAFVVSVIIGLNHDWGWKWLVPFVLGFLWMMLDYCTFGIANMIALGRLRLPNSSLMVDGSVVPLAGLILGSTVRGVGKLFRYLRSGRKKDEENSSTT